MEKLLNACREYRNFDAEAYLKNKTEAINDFFRDNKLDAAVVGVSGGIDSALVFSLLDHAAKQKDSPIKNIMGLVMPIFGKGTTNQDTASVKAIHFLRKFIREWHTIDLTGAYAAYVKNSEDDSEIKSTNWAKGQLASVVRTPCLYYHAAILQDRGFKSVVVGTTNRDEGSYIGFYGKASDGMVDVNIISDLHKSEVYKVAKLLGNITDEITVAKPSGDVYDGKNDEEMIGAPYWFLEMYLTLKNVQEFDIYKNISIYKGKEKDLFVGPILKISNAFKAIEKSKKIKKQYDTYAEAIEKLHDKNEHKYKVGMPCHFVDVMERTVHGGWK